MSGRWPPLCVWFAGVTAAPPAVAWVLVMRGDPSGEPAHRAAAGLVARAAGVGGLAAQLAVGLWWPETRRWCGLLPPADPEGADD